MATKKDEYADRAISSILMSAANTLTFEKVQFAVGVFQGVGIVIHSLEFHPGVASYREIVANTDYMTLALCATDRLANIVDDDPAIIATTTVVGMGASVEPLIRPIRISFTDLPGGGYIAAPNPLFIAMMTNGFVAAGSAYFRMYFTFIELSDAQYIELIQAQLPANV